jgi:hypothetical protein
LRARWPSRHREDARQDSVELPWLFKGSKVQLSICAIVTKVSRPPILSTLSLPHVQNSTLWM